MECARPRGTITLTDGNLKELTMKSYARPLALLIAMALSACTHSAAPLPATAGLSDAAVRPALEGSIVAWALFESDFCPSKAENIKLAFVALDASGAIIHGSYGTTITLKDTDRSGATKLSRTTISNSRQALVTLSYSGKKISKFYINVKIGSHNGFGTVSPYSPCVNHTPLVLAAHLSGKPTKLTLKGGSGAGAPYFINSSGDYSDDCNNKVTITQVNALLGQFRIAAATSTPGVCQVQAVATGAKDKGIFHGLNVLLVK